MAVRKRAKKGYLVKMEVTAIATQTMSGYITVEQKAKFMEHFDEHYLRTELSMDDDTEYTEWEMDALDLEQITIEGGDYKADWCWLKAENINDHPLVGNQKNHNLRKKGMSDAL
jgi:hypothetical protein